MVNLALSIESALRAKCIPNKQLYRTGNMKASINTVQIDENYIDIVIATHYASFTNERGKTAGWIRNTIRQVCECYAENNNVEDLELTGTIMYGG